MGGARGIRLIASCWTCDGLSCRDLLRAREEKERSSPFKWHTGARPPQQQGTPVQPEPGSPPRQDTPFPAAVTPPATEGPAARHTCPAIVQHLNSNDPSTPTTTNGHLGHVDSSPCEPPSPHPPYHPHPEENWLCALLTPFLRPHSYPHSFTVPIWAGMDSAMLHGRRPCSLNYTLLQPGNPLGNLGLGGLANSARCLAAVMGVA